MAYSITETLWVDHVTPEHVRGTLTMVLGRSYSAGV
jgi:hypothetical protein